MDFRFYSFIKKVINKIAEWAKLTIATTIIVFVQNIYILSCIY